MEHAHWESSVAAKAAQLKELIESGGSLPPSIQVQLNKHSDRQKRSLEITKMEAFVDKKKRKLNWLNVEARLEEIHAGMKHYLDHKITNLEHYMDMINEMASLKVDQLMLKDKPEVIETIMRLQKYIGDVPKNKEEKEFFQRAEEIRAKAGDLYKKFKLMVDHAHWESSLAARAAQIKMKIESGGILPPYIQAQLNQHSDRQKRTQEIMKLEAFVDNKKRKLDWLNVEARLEEIHAGMKHYLDHKITNLEDYMNMIDEMASLKVDQLMLKDKPEVIDTIMRLRQYIGNVPENKDQAQEIQAKAEDLYEKFNVMFAVQWYGANRQRTHPPHPKKETALNSGKDTSTDASTSSISSDGYDRSDSPVY